MTSEIIRERFHLNDWADANERRLMQARIFRSLVKLATPVLEGYESDLFHDALFLARAVTAPDMVLYWGLDPAGTSIGTSREYVERHKQRLYEIRIQSDGFVMGQV